MDDTDSDTLTLDMNRAIEKICDIYPNAKYELVAQAVAISASLIGENAYELLLEQAIDIYDRQVSEMLNEATALITSSSPATESVKVTECQDLMPKLRKLINANSHTGQSKLDTNSDTVQGSHVTMQERKSPLDYEYMLPAASSKCQDAGTGDRQCGKIQSKEHKKPGIQSGKTKKTGKIANSEFVSDEAVGFAALSSKDIITSDCSACSSTNDHERKRSNTVEMALPSNVIVVDCSKMEAAVPYFSNGSKTVSDDEADNANDLDNYVVCLFSSDDDIFAKENTNDIRVSLDTSDLMAPTSVNYKSAVPSTSKNDFTYESDNYTHPFLAKNSKDRNDSSTSADPFYTASEKQVSNASHLTYQSSDSASTSQISSHASEDKFTQNNPKFFTQAMKTSEHNMTGISEVSDKVTDLLDQTASGAQNSNYSETSNVLEMKFKGLPIDCVCNQLNEAGSCDPSAAASDSVTQMITTLAEIAEMNPVTCPSRVSPTATPTASSTSTLILDQSHAAERQLSHSGIPLNVYSSPLLPNIRHLKSFVSGFDRRSHNQFDESNNNLIDITTNFGNSLRMVAGQQHGSACVSTAVLVQSLSSSSNNQTTTSPNHHKASTSWDAEFVTSPVKKRCGETKEAHFKAKKPRWNEDKEYREPQRQTDVDSDEDSPTVTTSPFLGSSESDALQMETDASATNITVQVSAPDSIVTCEACDTYSPLIKCTQCRSFHIICLSCVEEEIRHTMGSDKMSLSCPVDYCNDVINTDVVASLLTPFVLDLLQQNLLQKQLRASTNAISQMTGLFKCPKCGFTGLMDENILHFVCCQPNCVMQCCQYCEVEWTKGEDHLGCQLLKFVGPECLTDNSKLPKNWISIPSNLSDQMYFKKIVPLSSYEGLTLISIYKKTSTSKINGIWRIQNKRLWEKYVLKRKHMVEEIGKARISEKFLFHGTRANNTEAICKEGFDIRLPNANGAVWGKGIYFSTRASYSETFSVGSNMLFLSRVLCGYSVKGKQTYLRPPCQNTKRLYDSCCDSLVKPSIYIVFDNSQCYPEYLIHYTWN